ncbi:hypothetical protein GSI_03531 [Ganoderma sinense ZZ0214-1]|uniref:Peptidase A1 domain-containing protein n=1 Tax=Ganoderma sinense ZZ0214-1 TaxID=1077348 RepID=A0A2G8SJ68_9APHY|nr:hypothetical protein GSI_03531 [Ganoderma sinense ZZ0214-1]
MPPSPRPQSLSNALLLLLLLALGAGSGVLADSGPVSLTVHPQTSRSPSCAKGTSLLKTACSSILDHKTYCSRYLAYCNSFAASFGDTTDRDVFSAYCSKTSKLNSCRQFSEAKGPATTTTSGQGHRRRYDSISSGFARRADPPANVTAENLDVDTSDTVWYAVEITLGGQNFTVQLDTGSSDLWIHPDAGRAVHFTNTTDLTASESYGENHVEGKINFADLKIGELTIQRQAFVHVADPADVHGFDLKGYDGILGMAFDVGSIHAKVQHEWGLEAADALARSPMTALFAQEPALPNSFDVQLSRPATEFAETASGLLVISAHAAGYEGVAGAPQLPRPRAAPQHWSVAMDAMLVNGESFAFDRSAIEGVPAGKVVAALDTGSSFPALPAAAIAAIYGSVPGAVYDGDSGLWLVPCDSSPNVTFVFGGQEFPVHPLDLTFPVTVTLSINERWNNEVTGCINTFQSFGTAPTADDGYDIVLADAFLHNVYASFDYGDWNLTNTDGIPFMQMVSTTDSATMWHDFSGNRTATLAQLPLPLNPAQILYYVSGTGSALPATTSTTSSPAGPSTTTTTATTSSSVAATQSPDTLAAHLSGAVAGDSDSAGGGESWGDKYGKVVLALLAANLAVGVALLAVVGTMCVRRTRRESSGPGRYAPVRFKEPLEDYAVGRGSAVSSD